jgi:hypothetical protein
LFFISIQFALVYQFFDDSGLCGCCPQEVLNNFEVARGQFPYAKVEGSTLDNFVMAIKDSNTRYREVTQEIGDTWIMGIQSDPKKIALYRLFARAMSDCFKTGGYSVFSCHSYC